MSTRFSKILYFLVIFSIIASMNLGQLLLISAQAGEGEEGAEVEVEEVSVRRVEGMPLPPLATGGGGVTGAPTIRVCVGFPPDQTYIPIDDDDGDGIYNGLDNCPGSPNPDQLDSDDLTLPENLIGYWRFNDDQPASSQDDSGHGHEITLQSVSRSYAAISGQALRFDESRSYAKIEHLSALDTADSFTLEAWLGPFEGCFNQPQRILVIEGCTQTYCNSDMPEGIYTDWEDKLKALGYEVIQAENITTIEEHNCPKSYPLRI